MMKIRSALLMLVLVGCGGPGSGLLETTTLAEAQRLAAASGRLILIDVATAERPPCEAFLRLARRGGALDSALDTVVLVRSEREGSKDLERWRRTVRAYPTFILLRADGQELDRWVGFGGAEDWLAHFDEGNAQRLTADEARARHAVHPSTATARRLARLAHDSSDPDGEVHYLDQAIALSGDGDRRLRFERLDALFDDAGQSRLDRQEQRAAVRAALQELRVACGEEVECRLALAERLVRRSSWVSDLIAEVEPLLAGLEPQADLELERRRIGLLASVAWLTRLDKVETLAIWQRHLAANPSDLTGGTRALAAWVFEYRIGFDFLLTTAQAALEREITIAHRAALQDTIGEALFNLARIDDAIVAMDEAARLDPHHRRHADTAAAWRELKRSNRSGPRS